MRDRSGSRGNDSYSDQVRNRSNASGVGGSYSGSYRRQTRGSGSGYSPGNDGYVPGNSGGGYDPGNGRSYGGYDPRGYNEYEDDVRESNGPFGFLHFDEGNMSVMKAIGLIVLGVLVIMLVVKIGMIIVTGFDPFVTQAKAVLDVVFNRLIEAVIGGVVVSFLFVAFLGKYLPVGIKAKFPIILILLLLVYSFAPALGSALGELVFIIIGIAILLNVFRF